MPVNSTVDSLQSQQLTSFQSIANNERLSDNSFVYTKNGAAKTEGLISHLFTRTSVKASTLNQLKQEIVSQYGASVGDMMQPLLKPFESGKTQMTVKDLRTIFATAEATKLDERVKELADVYGADMGNAFASTMGTRITAGGGRVANVDATAGRALELSDSLKSQLKGVSPRVAQALGKFLATSEQTNAAFKALLKETFPLLTSREVSSLSNGTNCKDVNSVVKQFLNATKENIGHEVEAFINDNLGGHSTLAASLGLSISAMKKANIELSDAIKKSVMQQYEFIKPQAEKLDQLSQKLLKDHPTASEKFRKLIKSESDKLAETLGRCDTTKLDEQLSAIKAKAEHQFKLETDYDYSIQDSLAKRTHWTPEQKEIFTKCMKFMQKELPQVNADSVTSYDILQRIVEGKGGKLSLSLFKDPVKIAIAEMLVGDNALGYISEKADALMQLPDTASARDYINTLFGHCPDLNVAPGTNASDVRRQTSELMTREFQNAVMRHDPELKKVYDSMVETAKANHPDYSPDAIHEDAIARISASLDPLCQQFDTAVNALSGACSLGVKMESAASRITNKDQAFTQTDMARNVAFDLANVGGTLAGARKTWLDDFSRQGVTQGADGIDVGPTNINIQLGGQTVSVHNGCAGLSAEEKKTFIEGTAHTSKTMQVEDSLRTLCNGNEKQLACALTALSQLGIVSLNLTLRDYVSHSDPKNEHSALVYNVSKMANGDLLIEAHTPDIPELAQFAKHQSKTIIRQNGQGEIVEFSLTPPKA